MSSFDFTSRPTITWRLYLALLVTIFALDVAQYFNLGLGIFSGAILVYGIPVLAIGVTWGSPIASVALGRMREAIKYGVGFFGAFSALGFFLEVVIYTVLVNLDPSAVNLLNRPNPVLNIPPELAWIMLFASLLIVGPAEEYIFRGFIYGYLLSLFRGRHWFSLALVSSVLFAAAHLYYAFVYGAASLIQFTDLVTFGMAMSSAYYLSGGNLVVPALLHGLYDATGFIGVATSPDIGASMRLSMIALGLGTAALLFVQRMRSRNSASRVTVS